MFVGIFITVSINTLSGSEKTTPQMRPLRNKQNDLEQFLDTGSCPDGDLSGLDLRETIQKVRAVYAKDEIDLSRADLSYSDLRYSDLSDTDLYETDLSGARLNGAILDGAYMWRTKLKRADFENASLKKAQLVFSVGDQVNFDGADFSGACLEGVIFSNSSMINALFIGAQLGCGARNIFNTESTCYLYDINALQANFENAKLALIYMHAVSFRSAQFKNTQFEDVSGKQNIFNYAKDMETIGGSFAKLQKSSLKGQSREICQRFPS